MLDFTIEPPRLFLINEIISHAEPGKTARAPVDRRAPAAGSGAPPLPQKRRRDDSLNNAKRATLQW